MLKFPFLYDGLRKTIKDVYKLVAEKKNYLEKNGKTPGILNYLTNRHPEFVVKEF